MFVNVQAPGGEVNNAAASSRCDYHTKCSKAFAGLFLIWTFGAFIDLLPQFGAEKYIYIYRYSLMFLKNNLIRAERNTRK